MILGVDVSTSITGFAVVAEGQIVYYDSIDLRKHKDIFAKTITIKEKILDLYEMYQLNNDDNSSAGFGDSKFPIESANKNYVLRQLRVRIIEGFQVCSKYAIIWSTIWDIVKGMI